MYENNGYKECIIGILFYAKDGVYSMFRNAEHTFTIAERTFAIAEYKFTTAEHRTKCIV